jgi:hypothetical protein
MTEARLPAGRAPSSPAAPRALLGLATNEGPAVSPVPLLLVQAPMAVFRALTLG